MKNLKISQLNYKDINQISLWDELYNNDPRFDSIKKYVLEDNAYWNLYELIEINYEKFEIGENEKKIALTLKNEQNEILGFLLGIVTDIKEKQPELIIQYLTINPEHQKQGLGKYFLKEILQNSKKYLGTETKKYFTRIDSSNYPSRKTFSSLGFNFTYTNSNFLVATLNTQENYKEWNYE